jgi:hypothetical protein
MIRVRKRCPEIGSRRWRIVPTRNRRVLALAYGDADAGTVVCVHNLDERQHVVNLGLDTSDRLDSLLDGDDSLPGGGKYRIQLDAHGYRW